MSYVVSVVLLAILPSVFAIDFWAGLLFAFFAVYFSIRSFKDSVDDLEKKSIGWAGGFCIGMLILDPEMLLAIAVVILLLFACREYNKHNESW